MHNSHFALDIDIFVLHSELSPDENHDGWLEVWFFFLSLGYESLSRRAGAETAPVCGLCFVLSELSSALL